MILDLTGYFNVITSLNGIIDMSSFVGGINVLVMFTEDAINFIQQPIMMVSAEFTNHVIIEYYFG